MPSLPSWTENDIRRLLAKYKIKAAKFEAVPLTGGCDNLNLLITLDDARVVLRRYSHTPEEEIEWELQLICYLAKHNFPTPLVFFTEEKTLSCDFLGRPAALFDFIPGREPSPQSPREAAQVAAAIAQLHLITQGLHLPHARSHTDWKRLERLDATASRFTSPGSSEMAAQALEFRQYFTKRLAEVNQNLPSGIVHHDAEPGNALLDERGKLVALLDFDEAHEGEFITDIASLLRLWATPDDWQGLKPKMTDAILSTYNKMRNLSEVEWELLPDFLLLYTLADAAEYVNRRLAADPTSKAVPECRAYQRFLALERESSWRGMLQQKN